MKKRRTNSTPDDPVFSLSRGGKLTALKRLWPTICEKAKLGDDLHIHDLRHSFAATILGGGSSLPIVGALLGHTQAATTKRYEHLADAPLRRALAAATKAKSKMAGRTRSHADQNLRKRISKKAGREQ